MKRPTLLACIAAMFAMAWLNTHAVAQPADAGAAGATVVGSLAGAPPTSAGGAPYASYVILIPTHSETQATPEMLAAIRHVSDQLGSVADQSPSGALFLGAPATRTYDAVASASTIADLNARYGFGLDPSGGAILLFVHGAPASAMREAVYARVFAESDTATLVAAMNGTGPILYSKGVDIAHPPTLWELIQHILVPTTTPVPPHE